MRPLFYFRSLLLLCALCAIFILFNSCYKTKYPLASIETSISNEILETNSKAYGSIIIKSRSNCECRKDQNVVIHKYKDHSVIHYSNNATGKLTYLYNISNKDLFDSVFTCDLYNSLRRGKSQKVISYSLYNKYNAFYYEKIKVNTIQMKIIYPGWKMRVYHDNTIDSSIVCEIECQKDESGAYLDVADFCNINNIELKVEFLDELSSKSILNGSYIHAMVWRWFPLGDNFVDVFSSRDTDSYLLQREADSVNVWLESNKVGHIMRGKIHVNFCYICFGHSLKFE